VYSTIATDSEGIPSKFGQYNPLYRGGGGGAAVNWTIVKNLTLTVGYIAGNPNLSQSSNGLFNGSYNALVQLAYRGDRGAIGVAYSRTFAPSGKADITGGTGSFLAARPFGNNIATSSDSVGVQGFYRLAPRFQVHGWGVYQKSGFKTPSLQDGFLLRYYDIYLLSFVNIFSSIKLMLLA